MPGQSKNGNGAGKRPIHVLEIVGNAIVGGMERYVQNMIRHLPADRFRFTCICPYESGVTAALRELGCEVFIAALQDDPPWRSIQTAVELIRHRHIDVIHAHMAPAHALAGLAGCLTQTPVVATLHTMNVPAQELGISRTTGSHLITVCHAAYSQALALGVPPDRVTLIPNGVDTALYTPARSGAPFRSTVGIPRDAPLVGFVGRLAPEKGPDQFVRAADYALRKRPDLHFVLVGEGLMERELVELIASLNRSNRIHLGGVWPDTSEVYPVFDLYVQASRSEGQPLALLEAMACGCPVVAMAVGGVPEVVEFGTTGMLAGPGDWVGLGDWIVGLLDHPERLRTMGAAARRRIVEVFNIETSAQRTGQVLQRLVEDGAAQPAVWRASWPTIKKVR